MQDGQTQTSCRYDCTIDVYGTDLLQLNVEENRLYNDRKQVLEINRASATAARPRDCGEQRPNSANEVSTLKFRLSETVSR